MLHGVQLWAALPDAHRHVSREFQHYAPQSVDLVGATARVFLGSLAGQTSPVSTFSPLLGAEIVLDPYARITIAVDQGHEHGILVDTGKVALAGTELAPSDLGFRAAGARTLELVNLAEEAARLVLLGGKHFDEDIVMWWNFVARSHDEIVAFRQAWQDQTDQFGGVEGYEGTRRWLLAPTLPNARIKPRSNR
jgi:redox-sensitive bicupin YhaK (pirin superfamily)